MTRRDGEDDDAPPPARPIGSSRRGAPRNPSVLAEEMRAHLREVGIDLDEEEKPTRPAARQIVADRAAIRAVLAPLGAPEWMIESCPSLEHANEYAKKTQKPE